MVKPCRATEIEQDLRAALSKHFGDDLYRSWFENCFYVFEPDTNSLTIGNGRRFAVEWIENHYVDKLRQIVRHSFGPDVKLEFRHDPKRDALRNVPEQDDQLDFFIPQLSEAALRDEIHLMEVAPFTLSRKESRTKIVYANVTGMNLTITCNPDHGMMTAHDYDFVLMMMAHLNEKANLWRFARQEWLKSKEGPEPEKPGRHFTPTTTEILRFMRKDGTGGNNYKQVEAMLDRLNNCTAKLERTGRRKRRAGTFTFIENYEVVSRSDSGSILEVRVTVPNWIYEGIVREDRPHLLTIDPDYLLLQRPIGKFLYRLAVIRAAKESAEIPLSEVYKRSGSNQPQKAFNRDLCSYIDDLIDLEGTERRFPDYNFSIVGKARTRTLRIEYRGQNGLTAHDTNYEAA